MKAKEFIPVSKPRNFVVKNQKTAGAGAHKDKKRAEKQGDVKHKKQAVPMEGVAEGDSPGMKDGRPYSDPLRRHPGNDSYMTPDYLIQKYQDELKKIAAGPYKRPKDVAMYQARIAKLQRQQGVAEVSKATIDRYVSKASDAHGDADFKARMSKHDPDKRSYYVDQKKTAEKRRQGISRALDRMSRQEDVAEGDNDWSDSQGNFAGDKPFNLGGDVAKRLDVNDTVSYFGEKATILAMSKDRTVSRIDLKSGITQNVKTSDLKRVGNSVAERVRDPEDWDEGNTEPANNFAVYINGKKWKVFKGRGQFADDYKERDHFRQLQSWAQQKSAATGKEWKVRVTGEAPTVSEARMSAQVKLSRAWDREQAKSAASRERAKELLNPAKKEEPKKS
jgi:hypothetical protein